MEKYGSVPPALANESRLGQVFLNLLVNAAQAIPEGHVDGNCITVRTLYDATRRRVITEVEDTGAGIPSDVMSKLFRPFFTTKTAGSGTGLGLAICQRVVASCGGEIHVDSTVGKGTIFRVELLATDGAPRRSPLAPPSSRAVHRSRILVIDDDPLIGKLTRRCLAPQHDVNATTNATDALARISAGERFDVILCDMMMPIMTGAGLHDALLDVAPEQAERMIFLTGGAFTQQTRSFLAELPNRQLAKPFTVEALRAIVNRRLKQVPG
jgi:CheY-like chemotaxis protein